MTDHLKASPPEWYEETSRHLLAQAQEELDKGDILQASDKVWEAVTGALKAHSRQRGWSCHTDNYLRDVARYVATEWSREDLRAIYGYLEALYHRLWERDEETDEVQNWLNSAAIYVREMAALQVSTPPGGLDNIPAKYKTDQENRRRRLAREPYVSPDSQYGPDDLSPEKCEEISRNQLRLARESLDMLDLERADVEVWNSAAYAIKALCKQQGWNHQDRLHLRAAIGYTAIEHRREDLRTLFLYLETESANYFQHPLGFIDIQRRVKQTDDFIVELAALRVAAPQASLHHLSAEQLEQQESRLGRLTLKSQGSPPSQQATSTRLAAQ